jgi:putative membrane protein
MFLEYFISFGLYFTTTVALFVVFLYLYAKVTPYDDYELIFIQNNIASALSFGGAIIGLSIPLNSALVHSISYVDFVMWGVVAMFLQLIFAFLLTRLSGRYSIKSPIINNNISVGIFVALMSISIGLINAGSMSY